jgi:hypothetical protein
VPIGLEKLLCLAAADPGFRSRLLTDRKEAARAGGWQLRPSEEAALAAMPEATLAALVARIDVERHPRRPFMQSVLAAALAAGATTVAMACSSPAVKAPEPAPAAEQPAPPADEPPPGGDPPKPGEPKPDEPGEVEPPPLAETGSAPSEDW